jgi:hypothetical protein
MRDLCVQVLSGSARSRWTDTASRKDFELLCFDARERPMLPMEILEVLPFQGAGVGGSAMPCGLVLPEARAKLAAGAWLPEVREAAAVN